MDLVLGGAMGLVLAVLLSSPPRAPAPPVTATVVEDRKRGAGSASRAKRA